MLERLRSSIVDETGAIGWLLVGVILGVVLIVWALLSLIF
jgi:hypothetical protein